MQVSSLAHHVQLDVWNYSIFRGKEKHFLPFEVISSRDSEIFVNAMRHDYIHLLNSRLGSVEEDNTKTHVRGTLIAKAVAGLLDTHLKDKKGFSPATILSAWVARRIIEYHCQRSRSKFKIEPGLRLGLETA